MYVCCRPVVEVGRSFGLCSFLLEFVGVFLVEGFGVSGLVVARR